MNYDELREASRKYIALLEKFVKEFIAEHPTWDEVKSLEKNGNHICIDYRTLEIGLKNESDLEKDENAWRHWARYKFMYTNDMWMYVKSYSEPLRPNYGELFDIALGAVDAYCKYHGIDDFWKLPQYLLPTQQEIDSVPMLLIIPDVHGRAFWKEAVAQYPEIPVIFLGDYLDPYNNHIESYTAEDALNEFKQILQYKQEHSDRVTLLLGNHDLHYFCSTDCSRKDYKHKDEILRLFEQNLHYFRIADTVVVNHKSFLFSHAGVLPGWLDMRFPEIKKDNAEEICNQINSKYHKDKNFLIQLVNDASSLRGGLVKFGSPVWADVLEHESNVPYTQMPKDYPYTLLGNIYQIFGHSQQEENPIYRSHFSCLDCRRAFLLTDKGQIMELQN